MPTQLFPSRPIRFGKALPVLLISVSCALCACAGQNNSPAPADPDREHSQGAPLQNPPDVAEQRIGEPAPSRAQTSGAQPAASAASQEAPLQNSRPMRRMSAQTGPSYIILQPGETLSYISALYAVSEKNLIDWNGLNSAQDIRAGQRLAIRRPDMQSAPPARRAAAPDQAGTGTDGVIVVAPGQSLSGIARSYGVTVAQLREWNGLTSDALQTGQHLRVQPPQARAVGASAAEGRAARRPLREPASGAEPDADGMITVQPGWSLSGVASKYKVGTADLRRWNKLKSDQLHIGQKLRVKAPVRAHTVREGENLSGIAAKYKVSAGAIMQKNKLADADVLPVGKELIIP